MQCEAFKIQTQGRTTFHTGKWEKVFSLDFKRVHCTKDNMRDKNIYFINYWNLTGKSIDFIFSDINTKFVQVIEEILIMFC
jgi:hypothetical protein